MQNLQNGKLYIKHVIDRLIITLLQFNIGLGHIKYKIFNLNRLKSAAVGIIFLFIMIFSEKNK